MEILSEVNPENVLMIDKSKQTMKFSSDIISVQKYIGGLRQFAKHYIVKDCELKNAFLSRIQVI